MGARRGPGLGPDSARAPPEPRSRAGPQPPPPRPRGQAAPPRRPLPRAGAGRPPPRQPAYSPSGAPAAAMMIVYNTRRAAEAAGKRRAGGDWPPQQPLTSHSPAGNRRGFLWRPASSASPARPLPRFSFGQPSGAGPGTRPPTGSAPWRPSGAAAVQGAWARGLGGLRL